MIRRRPHPVAMAETPRVKKSLPKILVIDDDASVVTALQARLGGFYRVIGLEQPERAVEVAQSEQPCLVLCDINMPGMTGDEVALALSMDARTQFIPVVYLTSLLPASAAVELGQQFGNIVGLSKKSSTAQMLEVIRSAIAR
ncbi:MAG: response regulator [Comamonadaceae bacterium]|nr:MAG: response regulator [Comamonadaceae bacterium]